MFAQASHEYVVISDSDVGVEPDYLRRVVAPLLDDETGLVMCLYRGVPTGGFWAGLEALGMSVEMAAGVVAASSMGEVNFALGPTMATRRKVVESVGGIGVLASTAPTTTCWGIWLRVGTKGGHQRQGHRSLRSEPLVQNLHSAPEALDDEHALFDSARTRQLGNELCNPIRSAGGNRGMEHRPSAAGPGAVGLDADQSHGDVGRGGLGRGAGQARAGLLLAVSAARPDGLWLWLASYAGDTVDWRGEKYRLVVGGRMVRVNAANNDGTAENESGKSLAVRVTIFPELEA